MGLVNALAQGVMLGGLFALLALGLSIMFGVMRIVNLAHGDFAVLAAYLVLSGYLATDLPLLLVVGVGLPVYALVGYVVQRVIIRRALAAGPLSPLLATFGISVVIQNALLQAYSADTRTLDVGALGTGSFRISNAMSLSYVGLLTLVLAIGATSAIQLFLARSRTGRMMRAVSDDAEAASLVGADSRHLYAVATAIAFASVALAGVMFGARSAFDPSIGSVSLLFAFEAVVIGGLGSLWGTLVGGIVLGVTQAVASYVDPSLAVLTGHLVFLAVLAVRPQGLLPQRMVA